MLRYKNAYYGLKRAMKIFITINYTIKDIIITHCYIYL